jgi:hypothetical protein
MQNKPTQKKKETYTKPVVHTHEPLRNITADGPGIGREPTPSAPL